VLDCACAGRVEVGVEDYLESLAKGLPAWGLARSSEALFFAQKLAKGLVCWFSKGCIEDCRGGVEEGYIVLWASWV
jgi:hypothetical protein